MLSKLILCYLSDPVALGAVSLFAKNDLPCGYRCLVEDQATEIEYRGIARLGYVYAQHEDKHGKRIVLVFLRRNDVNAAKMIERLNRHPQNAILIATAVEAQKSELAKRDIDTSRGYAEIYGGRPPYVDLPNALLITDEKKSGPPWHQELAGALIRDFLYSQPQPRIGEERRRTLSPEEHRTEAQ